MPILCTTSEVNSKKNRRTMQHSFMAMLAAEFIGTAILMIFGNGAVANVELKNTKGVIGPKVCLLVGVS